MLSVVQVLGLVAALSPAAYACTASTGGIPKNNGRVSSKEVITVPAGEVWDGGNRLYDRGPGACNGQAEGGQRDAVFLLQPGATLRNVIIGKDQSEGIHCNGACRIENVWFEDVCEDAITIKGDKAGAQTHIVGGGAYNAKDKVIQHNGCGTVNISNFYVQNYGKLYRSCGNCRNNGCARTVNIRGVTARNGGELAGINSNYGDRATLTNVCTSKQPACQTYQGCAGCREPKKLGPC